LEAGPVTILDGNFTVEHVNPYAWTSKYNLLAIDVAGVGFVAGTAPKNDADMVNALSSALQAFFTAFPDQKTRPLVFIAESYAASYVGTLANKTKAAGFDKPISIIFLNPYSGAVNAASDSYDHLFGHQMYGMEVREIITTVCVKDPTSARCRFARNAVADLVSAMHPYNVELECQTRQQQMGEYAKWWLDIIRVDQTRLQPYVSCLHFGGLEDYISRLDVQKAFFIVSGDNALPFATCRASVRLLHGAIMTVR
jgi:hypothetical protein